jgi:hypothetical protein
VYVPALANVTLADLPWPKTPVSKLPLSAVALCPTESSFIQVTLSPTLTRSVAGEKLKLLILTSCVLIAAGDVVAEPADGETETVGLLVAVGIVVGVAVACVCDVVFVVVLFFPRIRIAPTTIRATMTIARRILLMLFILIHLLFILCTTITEKKK